MTNEEFYSELKKATSLEEIAKLRKICGATRFISACKEKIANVASKEGFQKMEVSSSCLKSLTNFTDCGQFFTFDVPTKNRKFRRILFSLYFSIYYKSYKGQLIKTRANLTASPRKSMCPT